MTSPRTLPRAPKPGPIPAAPIDLEIVSGLLRGLDRQQRRAVTHGEGPLLVLAGPGAGKTHVVTRRIAWLIATKRARPEQILALTFTERAADEMQARVDLLVPYGQAGTDILTFHAFGDRLIRDHALELGLPGEPRVLGRDRGRHPARRRHRAARACSAIDRSRIRRGTWVPWWTSSGGPRTRAPARPTSWPWPPPCRPRPVPHRRATKRDALAERAAAVRELGGAYEAYQRLLVEAGAVDHGDQLAMAVRLLRDHASVRAALRERYRYLLVDEFQDTNPAQLDLLELLGAGTRNVTVVGDDDQAIYAFRGAAVENLIGFGARFPGTRTIALRRNHRSRRTIVEAARRLIRHNDPHRLEARDGIDRTPVVTRRARPLPVAVRTFSTVAEEADWVAAEVRQRLDRRRRAAGRRRPRAHERRRGARPAQPEHGGRAMDLQRCLRLPRAPGGPRADGLPALRRRAHLEHGLLCGRDRPAVSARRRRPERHPRALAPASGLALVDPRGARRTARPPPPGAGGAQHRRPPRRRPASGHRAEPRTVGGRAALRAPPTQRPTAAAGRRGRRGRWRAGGRGALLLGRALGRPPAARRSPADPHRSPRGPRRLR